MAPFADRDEVLIATARFFSVELPRLQAADQEVASWNLPNLERVLLSSLNADGAIGSLFLAESVQLLEEHRVERSQIMRKLRDDPDVWPTWAELRAAAKLAETLPEDALFELEPHRNEGKHADFGITYANGETASIEFKAIGLSDAEAEFSRRAADRLPSLIPARGFVTIHTRDMRGELRVDPEGRKQMLRAAPRAIMNAWPGARSAAAAVMVGHGGEPHYARRLAARLREALDQLPGEKACWAAFHWTNGAPIRLVAEALRSMVVPDRVERVILIGSVAHPGLIHNYIHHLIRPFNAPRAETTQVVSKTEDVARGVLQRVEQSAGVRPTILRVPTKHGMRDLINRGGEQRIVPFGLVLDSDPEWVAGNRTPEFESGDSAK